MVQLLKKRTEKFPFHSQETSYTCGAAALRMVFEKLGIKKTEKQIKKLLGTNKIIGTWEKDFPKLVEKYKLKYAVEHRGSIKDLRKFQKENYLIIICYYNIKEKVDHYAVLKKIDFKKIILYDPYYGPDKQFSLLKFKTIWRNKKEKDKKWFIAIKR